MELSHATTALAALAQVSRLTIFRWLIQRHPQPQSASAIAEALDFAPPTLSFHLSQLRHAGLVDVERRGRQRLYVARLETMGALLQFLVADCCGGEPDACQSLLAGLATSDTKAAPSRSVGGGPRARRGAATGRRGA